MSQRLLVHEKWCWGSMRCINRLGSMHSPLSVSVLIPYTAHMSASHLEQQRYLGNRAQRRLTVGSELLTTSHLYRYDTIPTPHENVDFSHFTVLRLHTSSRKSMLSLRSFHFMSFHVLSYLWQAPVPYNTVPYRTI